MIRQSEPIQIIRVRRYHGDHMRTPWGIDPIGPPCKEMIDRPDVLTPATEACRPRYDGERIHPEGDP